MTVDPNFIQFLEDRRHDLHVIASAKMKAATEGKGRVPAHELLRLQDEANRAMGVVEGLAIAVGHATNWTGKKS